MGIMEYYHNPPSSSSSYSSSSSSSSCSTATVTPCYVWIVHVYTQEPKDRAKYNTRVKILEEEKDENEEVEDFGQLHAFCVDMRGEEKDWRILDDLENQPWKYSYEKMLALQRDRTKKELGDVLGISSLFGIRIQVVHHSFYFIFPSSNPPPAAFFRFFPRPDPPQVAHHPPLLRKALPQQKVLVPSQIQLSAAPSENSNWKEYYDANAVGGMIPRFKLKKSDKKRTRESQEKSKDKKEREEGEREGQEGEGKDKREKGKDKRGKGKTKGGKGTDKRGNVKDTKHK